MFFNFEIFRCFPTCRWLPLLEGGFFACMASFMTLIQSSFPLGGISPRLHSLDDIRRLERPIPIVIEPGLVQDLLWADPCPDVQLRGFQSNDLRNCSHVFGEEALTTKLKLLNIDMIIRAHQVKYLLSSLR